MLTNLRNAFGGQSRSPNIVPFHMLGIVSYCATVTLSLRRAVFYNIQNLCQKEKWQKESYKPVAIAVRLRSTPML